MPNLDHRLDSAYFFYFLPKNPRFLFLINDGAHNASCCMVDVDTQDVNLVTRVAAHAKTELSRFDKDCKLIEN